MYALSDYSYILPDRAIAQEAIHPHHDARLMIVDRESGKITAESTFWNLGDFLSSDRVLYFNNSRVIPARIRLSNQNIETHDGKNGVIQEGEILFTEKVSEHTFHALVRPGKKFKIGTKIFFDDGYVVVRKNTEGGRLFESIGCTIEDIMESHGELPLPPYIQYSKEKEKDYQTSFATNNGSVAAPTASLHFTKELLEKLPNEKEFLTLHVGLGTFKGIDTPDVRTYQIHREKIEVPLMIFQTIAENKKSGKLIVAVGTTACRTLESLPHLWKKLDEKQKGTYSEAVQAFWNRRCGDISVEDVIHNILTNHSSQSIQFETSIYIYPSVPFRIIDELITNFHLPESSLLVLVGALIGRENILSVYEYAIEHSYRFFSFGDGMYIRKGRKL